MKAINISFFVENLKFWYEKNKRNLPWRHTIDPYMIWLSEIILQQTRVAQGLPYYLKFVEAFPTISDFANAQESEILRHWQGLGYYSRARNMHSTAKNIIANFSGVFPNNYNDLLKLKGVGPYTAAAIASFSNNENVAVLDGNVYRVLARYFGVDIDIASNEGKKHFTKLAVEILPKEYSAIHNQAIMEFGALQCSPVPHCTNCPVNLNCIAFHQKLQNVLPVKSKKLTIKNRHFYYLVVEINNKYYLNEREGKGIWQGLYDFLLIEKSNNVGMEEILEFEQVSQLFTKDATISLSDEYVHLLTHQKLHIYFIYIKLNKLPSGFYEKNLGKFYTKSEIELLPKPIIVAKYFQKNHSSKLK